MVGNREIVTDSGRIQELYRRAISTIPRHESMGGRIGTFKGPEPPSAYSREACEEYEAACHDQGLIPYSSVLMGYWLLEGFRPRFTGVDVSYDGGDQRVWAGIQRRRRLLCEGIAVGHGIQQVDYSVCSQGFDELLHLLSTCHGEDSIAPWSYINLGYKQELDSPSPVTVWFSNNRVVPREGPVTGIEVGFRDQSALSAAFRLEISGWIASLQRDFS